MPVRYNVWTRLTDAPPKPEKGLPTPYSWHILHEAKLADEARSDVELGNLRAQMYGTNIEYMCLPRGDRP